MMISEECYALVLELYCSLADIAGMQVFSMVVKGLCLASSEEHTAGGAIYKYYKMVRRGSATTTISTTRVVHCVVP